MSVAEQFDNDAGYGALTQEMAGWIASARPEDMSPLALTWAKHALLDWFGVTIAGSREPLVDILIDEYAADGHGSCTIVARGVRSIASHAALINGSASHALDYDDVNRRLHGHPTVTVAPVVLAMAEKLGVNGKEALTGLIVGTEAACLIGEMAGHGHYEAGYHATGTIGTFGAAAAAAQMMGLDETGIRHALGIAASQAAGLKSNFGTMTKPLHAGKAAMNGLMAARLAARGFTANDSVLECPQGTIDVMMPDFEGGSAIPHPPGYYSIQQMLFKYHAACYLTHASIEAIKDLKEKHQVGIDDLESMTLYSSPGHFTVCNIPDPKTGLEIKFSIRHCAAMALDGADTSALETYSDANALDARYGEARGRIALEARDDMDRMKGHVVLKLKDGREIEAEADAGQPADDVAVQEAKLKAKFLSLSQPVFGEKRTEDLLKHVMELEQAQNVAVLMKAAE